MNIPKRGPFYGALNRGAFSDPHIMRLWSVLDATMSGGGGGLDDMSPAAAACDDSF